MFPNALFTHKYDIDDIIAALCAEGPQWLNTETGAFSATQPDAPGHAFSIQPLPAGFIDEIATSDERRHLSAAEQTELDEILGSGGIQTLPDAFSRGRTGGWLRERLKDAALEWLDGNDLIPPSMRHINRQKAAKLYASAHVTIVEED